MLILGHIKRSMMLVLKSSNAMKIILKYSFPPLLLLFIILSILSNESNDIISEIFKHYNYDPHNQLNLSG